MLDYAICPLVRCIIVTFVYVFYWIVRFSNSWILLMYAMVLLYFDIHQVLSALLLWREIPMAWGTTTDSLTLEINPFQYAIEIKYLTLKNQTSYLIPDG